MWEKRDARLDRLERELTHKDKRYYDGHRQSLYRLRNEEDIFPATSLELKYNIGEGQRLPELHVADISALFDAIGFDYKTKKWLTKPNHQYRLDLRRG